jgi:molybdopterin-containing oxidoreductase family membrane subunit
MMAAGEHEAIDGERARERMARDSLTAIAPPLIVPQDLQPLPRTRLAWLIAVGLALAGIAFGVYAFSVQWREGLIVTDHRNPGHGGAAWGLYVGFYVYFVGVSFAGITIAALCRLFNIEALRPLSRLAELLTISALLVGAAAIVIDLGRPLDGLIKLPRFANPQSPFFGTFTLVVSGYLVSSVVYFLLAGRADAAAMARTARGPLRWFYLAWASGYRDTPAEQTRHRRVSYWLAITILPLLVVAHSTLGFIFGIQSGRPGWYSALQAPAFVIMAGVSGIGMVIVVGAGVRRLCGIRDRIPDASLRWLGNLLWVLALVYLYLMLVEELTATYAAPEADRHVAHEITKGTFAPMFWLTVGCLLLTFLIPFTLYLRRKISVPWLVAAGLLANVAAIVKRFLIVVPSQTHGALTPLEAPLPQHVPSWVELGVIAGLFGGVALIILVFVRVFPIVPTPHAVHRVRVPRDPLRTGLTVLTALVALALIGIGLADSFRLFSRGEIDPVIPYSPVMFATGVMLLFSSAFVYEVFPDRTRSRLPPTT